MPTRSTTKTIQIPQGKGTARFLKRDEIQLETMRSAGFTVVIDEDADTIIAFDPEDNQEVFSALGKGDGIYICRFHTDYWGG